ncbi:hypothetical protein FJZ31_06685 [Candidatus Poribacteria bacterium]|nr:hypothetical protein [Candidatus Poribacteria bacterium]
MTINYEHRFSSIAHLVVLTAVFWLGCFDIPFVIQRLEANALFTPHTNPKMLANVSNDDVGYSTSKIRPEDITVIKIGINNKDIPKEYDTAIIGELRKELMNEQKEIEIKRYGDGWFSRKKMGWDFYRGVFDYLTISKKTYDSDGFQEAVRKYKEKLSLKVTYRLEIHPDDKDAFRVLLLDRKIEPTNAKISDYSSISN